MGTDLKWTSLDPAEMMEMWSARSVVELPRSCFVSGCADLKIRTRERWTEKQRRTDVTISRNNKSGCGKGEV